MTASPSPTALSSKVATRPCILCGHRAGPTHPTHVAYSVTVDSKVAWYADMGEAVEAAQMMAECDPASVVEVRVELERGGRVFLVREGFGDGFEFITRSGMSRAVLREGLVRA